MFTHYPGLFIQVVSPKRTKIQWLWVSQRGRLLFQTPEVNLTVEGWDDERLLIDAFLTENWQAGLCSSLSAFSVTLIMPWFAWQNTTGDYQSLRESGIKLLGCLLFFKEKTPSIIHLKTIQWKISRLQREFMPLITSLGRQPLQLKSTVFIGINKKTSPTTVPNWEIIYLICKHNIYALNYVIWQAVSTVKRWIYIYTHIYIYVCVCVYKFSGAKV